MQSIVRDRALNCTQSIDRVRGQNPTQHPSLVHLTTHIKTTTVALQVALCSKYVNTNLNNIRGQKNIVKLTNTVEPTVIFKLTY
jgi:hypothetical protein